MWAGVQSTLKIGIRARARLGLRARARIRACTEAMLGVKARARENIRLLHLTILNYYRIVLTWLGYQTWSLS